MWWTLVMMTAGAVEPKAAYAQLPDAVGLAYTAVDVDTADGAHLKVWWLPNPKKSKRTILLVPDGTGNMGDNLDRVAALEKLGYNVVAFDYRGFGGSSAFEMNPNLYFYPHFVDDVSSMITWTSIKAGGPIDLMGWGFGAGLGLGIGWLREDVRRIVADGPFSSIDALEKVFERRDPSPEVPFAGYDKMFEPIYALDGPPHIAADSEKAVLLIGSLDDDVCTPADLAALRMKQPQVTRPVVVVPNPEHKDTFDADRDAYLAAVSAFLKK